MINVMCNENDEISLHSVDDKLELTMSSNNTYITVLPLSCKHQLSLISQLLIINSQV